MRLTANLLLAPDALEEVVDRVKLELSEINAVPPLHDRCSCRIEDGDWILDDHPCKRCVEGKRAWDEAMARLETL